MRSVLNDFLGISRKFAEQLFHSDYFLNISRTPFNPLTAGGNGRLYILNGRLYIQQAFN